MDANTSSETATNNSSGCKDTKRQQFTNKQRMDMYAFCVLELEMHSNKVSIKKQQLAIQKVLNQQQKGAQNTDHQLDSSQQQLTQQQHPQQQQQQPQPPQLQPQPSLSQPVLTTNQHPNTDQLPPQLQEQQQQPPTLTTLQPQSSTLPQQSQSQPQTIPQQNGGEHLQPNDSGCDLTGIEGKTLLQLQQEVAMTRKCYSDYQKTQVLTSSMLRDVQKRFAKYYPDSAIPSRTTIKHVFEKCVAHGTVENIKTPRKATKIPQGDEIEFLLIHEPQLSLRQMAQKLNVSTGTVSRRCKALGLVPESVTIKHQQLATARRQKQMKQLESQTKPEQPTSNGNSNGSSNNNNSTSSNHKDTTTSTPSNGTHQIGGDLPKYLSK